MLNPKIFANSRPDGIGALEIIRDAGREQPRQFIPLKRSELSGEITGPLAALRLTHVYGYTREQFDGALEAVYRFPLPGDAAVTSVRVSFGAVEINAELKERERAEADYETARQQGRQAALATRESPDVFTLRVAGLQPDQEIKVETHYAQAARAEGEGWSLRIPLTTAPRYVRDDEIGSRHAQGQPLALLRDPGHRFALDLKISGAGGVSSSTHQLQTTTSDEGLRVALRDGEVTPDRDCVIVWQAPREAARPALQVWLHDDADTGQVYFLALVAPPAAQEASARVSREVILLVDHSGSMEGAKWRAADWAVKSFLHGLSERDAFALGLFHSATKWFDQKTRQADGRAIEEAIRFLEHNRDSGGTELGVALEQAIHLAPAPGERSRHILIITDAEVSDEGRILRLAEDRREAHRRISALCIDAAPNSHLVLELTERGGGIAKFLTSNPEEEDITTALDEALADWAAPALADLRLEVNSPVAQAAGRAVSATAEAGWSGIDLGDLPVGRAVWVAGRAPRSRLSDLTFKLTAGHRQTVAEHRPAISETACAHPAIKALFGARRVLGLEYLIHSGHQGEELRERLTRLGYDPSVALAPPAAKVFAENARADARAALRALLVREALDYGLASSETAFVAVRQEAGRVIDASVIVANALPAGWSDNFLSGPPAMALRSSPAYPAAASLFDAAMDFMDAPPSSAPPTSGLTGSAPPTGGLLGGVRRMAAMFRHRAMPEAEEMSGPPDAPRSTLFAGAPNLTGGEAVLFDSTRDQTKLPQRGTISRLLVSFPDGAPEPGKIDAGLTLLVFVGDAASPSARVRLTDLARQGGERPLNLLKQPAALVRVVLADAGGAWARGAPRIEVAIEWENAIW